jgi:hypothetical protein
MDAMPQGRAATAGSSPYIEMREIPYGLDSWAAA